MADPRPCNGEKDAKRRCRKEEDGVRPSFLERFFAKYEFTCEHMISCSDCQAWTTREVLAVADPECQAMWDASTLGYTESLGHPKLLDEIRKHYTYRLGNAPSQIPVQITTCVPVEGIFVAMTALLSAGDRIIAMMPAYQALYEIARSKRCCILPWTPHYSQTGFWEFRLSDLQSILDENITADAPLKMLMINSPHNPTGAAFDQSQLDAVCELVTKLPQTEPAVIFSDEMYSEIIGPESPSMVGKARTVVLSGLSKPWGMPGLRMGWLICSNSEDFKSMISLRDYTTLCLPPHCEILSIITLRCPETFLVRNRQIAASNYLLLQKVLESLPHWFYPMNQHQQNDRPQTWRAAVVFGRLKLPLGGVAHGVPAQLQSISALAEHLAKEHSICMAVSDFFEFDNFPCVRFGLGREAFPEALQKLQLALQKIAPGAQ
ncbi:vioD [Symbiodinium pilosum]|uniref:VioD protein n=1 Tax=Symbiodinium pilosum TaxID=2952 RepID=A0A812YCT9_SYMPI|nr:vioD [Symbiodinium pilosum]